MPGDYKRFLHELATETRGQPLNINELNAVVKVINLLVDAPNPLVDEQEPGEGEFAYRMCLFFCFKRQRDGYISCDA